MRKAKSNPGRKLAALVLSCAAVVSAAVAAPIVYGYQEGLAQATENGLWGFVDTTGSVPHPLSVGPGLHAGHRPGPHKQ